MLADAETADAVEAMRFHAQAYGIDDVFDHARRAGVVGYRHRLVAGESLFIPGKRGMRCATRATTRSHCFGGHGSTPPYTAASRGGGSRRRSETPCCTSITAAIAPTVRPSPTSCHRGRAPGP